MNENEFIFDWLSKHACYSAGHCGYGAYYNELAQIADDLKLQEPIDRNVLLAKSLPDIDGKIKSLSAALSDPNLSHDQVRQLTQNLNDAKTERSKIEGYIADGKKVISDIIKTGREKEKSILAEYNDYLKSAQTFSDAIFSTQTYIKVEGVDADATALFNLSQSSAQIHVSPKYYALGSGRCRIPIKVTNTNDWYLNGYTLLFQDAVDVEAKCRKLSPDSSPIQPDIGAFEESNQEGYKFFRVVQKFNLSSNFYANSSRAILSEDDSDKVILFRSFALPHFEETASLTTAYTSQNYCGKPYSQVASQLQNYVDPWCSK